MEKIAVITLGCAKNRIDSELMLGTLASNGYSITDDPSTADLIIVNTCGFIEPAKEESIETILEAAKFKKVGRCKGLIVSGCLSERYAEDLRKELREADIVIGLREEAEIARYCDLLLGREIRSAYSRGERRLTTPDHWAYLRIADGCNNRCSYCAIPLIRGPYRSRDIRLIVDEAWKLAEYGVKELNLVAQDTLLYGVDIYGKSRITDLLEQLLEVEGIRWIRLMYAHPAHLTDDVIELIRDNDKICRYIDLPIQHISDRILGRMNRRVTSEQIRELIGKLRDRIPDIAIRTSLIVGFPGETERDFRMLLDFMREVKFDRLGAFIYSREEGTPATDFRPQIGRRIKEERLHEVMELQREISSEINSRFVGKVVEVMVEGEGGERGVAWIGRSEREAPEVDGEILITGCDAAPGDFVEVLITDSGDYDLYGRML